MVFLSCKWGLRSFFICTIYIEYIIQRHHHQILAGLIADLFKILEFRAFYLS